MGDTNKQFSSSQVGEPPVTSIHTAAEITTQQFAENRVQERPGIQPFAAMHFRDGSFSSFSLGDDAQLIHKWHVRVVF